MPFSWDLSPLHLMVRLELLVCRRKTMELRVHTVKGTLVRNVQTFLALSPRKCPLFLCPNLSIRMEWIWRRQWHPTPVLLPGKSHGRRSLVGCSPWGREESDTTERLHFHFSLSCIGEGNGTHSSVLAWRIPGTVEPVGCHLWGRTESDMTEAT